MGQRFAAVTRRALGAATSLLLFAFAPPALASDVRIHVKLATPKDQDTVLVYLTSSKPMELSPPESPLPLSLKGSRFTPRVMGVVVGSKVDLTNYDSVVHDIFADSDVLSFDTGHYPTGARRILALDKAGRLDLRCHLHPAMKGVILVLETPLFGSPDSTGHLVISGARPGEYQLHVFRADVPETTSAITVAAQAVTELEL